MVSKKNCFSSHKHMTPRREFCSQCKILHHSWIFRKNNFFVFVFSIGRVLKLFLIILNTHARKHLGCLTDNSKGDNPASVFCCTLVLHSQPRLTTSAYTLRHDSYLNSTVVIGCQVSPFVSRCLRG